jgi:hypothetical protein
MPSQRSRSKANLKRLHPPYYSRPTTNDQRPTTLRAERVRSWRRSNLLQEIVVIVGESHFRDAVAFNAENEHAEEFDRVARGRDAQTMPGMVAAGGEPGRHPFALPDFRLHLVTKIGECSSNRANLPLRRRPVHDWTGWQRALKRGPHPVVPTVEVVRVQRGDKVAQQAFVSVFRRRLFRGVFRFPGIHYPDSTFVQSFSGSLLPLVSLIVCLLAYAPVSLPLRLLSEITRGVMGPRVVILIIMVKTGALRINAVRSPLN